MLPEKLTWIFFEINEKGVCFQVGNRVGRVHWSCPMNKGNMGKS